MVEFPGENTTAGSILAVMLVISPIVSLILSAMVKPKLLAFFSGAGASLGLITGGVSYVVSTAPSAGTETGGLVFGGMAAFLSLGAATVITVGRALLGKSTAEIYSTPPHTPSLPQ